MKKLFVLLGVFCALCFVACSNFQLAGGDMGVVSLSIGDNLAREIRSAAASRNVADGTYTLTASIRGDYSDSQTVTVADGNYSGVTFTFEDVPVGKNIILDLTAKADGNYIWYGNSGKHTVEQGENLLTIALGRVSGVLLWNNSSVKIAPYEDLNSMYSSSLPSNLELPLFWCFDNTGNLYWSAKGRSSAWCYNLQHNLQPSKLYIDSKVVYNYINRSFSALSYDNSTNILYGIVDDGALKYWQKTGGESHDILLDGGTGLFSDSLGFTVHNNIVYCATNALGVVKLSSYKLEDAPDGGSKTATTLLGKTFMLPEVFGNNAPITSQMIYQEGALYLLLGSVSSSFNVGSDDTKVYSCGALFKINPSTLTLDTSFGTNGYLGLVSERTISGNYNGGSYSMNLYSPTESNENSAFYGPVGFVAVMPKKLVIADAGFVLSENPAGDRLPAYRKCRVVTVDLETQAFAVTSLGDKLFYGNIPSGCGFEVIYSY